MTAQRVRRWRVLVAAALAAGAPSCGLVGGSDSGPLVVGAVTFAENQLVAEMYALSLEAAGFRVERRFNFQRREELYPELAAGEVDVAPEYLASLLTFLRPDASTSSSAAHNAAALRSVLARDGLRLLEPSAANDTNAIVVTAETARRLELETVSDLVPHAGRLVFGGPPECPQRRFCLQGLRQVYGLRFKSFRSLDAGGPLTIAALEAGEIDVALLFSTSGIIAARGWVVLEDDRELQAADNIAPVVRTEVLEPAVQQALDRVSRELTTAAVTELNARVEVRNENFSEVARDFLDARGVIGAQASAQPRLLLAL